MTKYIGMVICNVYPRLSKRETKENEDFLEEVDEEKDARMAQR